MKIYWFTAVIICFAIGILIGTGEKSFNLGCAAFFLSVLIAFNKHIG